LDAEEVAISELLLESHGIEPRIVQGRGESLPWPDESFDLVTCQQVLEHVDDIDRVVSEMIRVARPGGALFVSTPNYLFPYEGHYMVKWFPLLPKRIGAMILKAKGRDPTFLLEHVNYTTYLSMRRLWRRHGLPARNITLELFPLRSQHATMYRSSVVRRAVLALRLFPNVSWLVTKPPR
jgi:SAM-dependent methyltransferase